MITLLMAGMAILPLSAGQELLVVPHRGLLHHAPENTLANFRACLELGMGFEFDVQRAKDGELVCIHDDTLDRTTNGKGRVADFPLAAIRELDAGGWFSPRFKGEKVPTVEEVMALVAARCANHIGDLDGFHWAVTREDALQAKRTFRTRCSPGDMQYLL